MSGLGDDLKITVDFIDELNELLECRRLLYSIWLQYGPYKNGTIEHDTWEKVNRLMKFDDSE